jgi:NifU-like protein involved in Fe-S cluster formation
MDEDQFKQFVNKVIDHYVIPEVMPQLTRDDVIAELHNWID